MLRSSPKIQPRQEKGRGGAHPLATSIPAIITGVLVSTASPPVKSDPRDLSSLTAIITHPAYAALPRNIYHNSLYPDESPEQKIFALGLIPKADFKQTMEEYKQVIARNKGFADFCIHWKSVSEKHKIPPENQAKLFFGLYRYNFISFSHLGIREYIGLYEPNLLAVLSEITHGGRETDCEKIASNVTTFLKSTEAARNKELEDLGGFGTIVATVFTGGIGLVILAFWYTERRKK